VLHSKLVLCHVFEIKFIEMCETAVPATDGKMTAAYHDIMGTSHMTVPAFRRFKNGPDIITPDRCKSSRLSDIFNTGNKNTGCPAVFTRNLCFIGYCFYDLVCHLLAVVTVSSEFCKNEPVAHGRYWMCTGSLTCCHNIL
jgi:hypothetical protein